MILRNRIDMACPFCGLKASVGTAVLEPHDELPAEMAGAEVVTHDEPRCVQFEQMDTATFARWGLGRSSAKRASS